MTNAVIVQARMASKRLPGKILLPIGDGTVLDQVLKRCLAIKNIDNVVCAIPDSKDCNAIATVASRFGVTVFRGSADDVLARYLGAAKVVNAHIIVRITSDCPLIDPKVCSDVLDLVLGGNVDFACNNMPRSWPHGLDCEAVTIEWLARAAKEAKDPWEREHVMPWIRHHPDVRIANHKGPGNGIERHRWTLDTKEDYDFLQAIWPHLYNGASAWDYTVPLAIVKKFPEIACINAQSGY